MTNGPVRVQEKSDSQETNKADWAAPRLMRLQAGAAENADQPGSDDGINLAS